MYLEKLSQYLKSFIHTSLALQPPVDLGLLKKLCPFVSVESNFLLILDF